MYKRDYHPDENIVFKTKNYGFDAPKSTPLEPLSNALVQIDSTLKAEEVARIAEDVRTNARVDQEILDRKKADENILNITLQNSDYNIIAGYNVPAGEKITYPAYQIGKSIYAIAWLYQPKDTEGAFTIWIPKNAQNVRGLNTAFFADSAKNVKLFSWIRDPEKDTANYVAYTTENIPPVNVKPLACTAQIITFTI